MKKNRQVAAACAQRAQVAAKYLQGLTQEQIAVDLGLTVSQVGRDLERMRAQWLASSLVDFDARKAEELAKVDRLEAVAWEAWERSCEDAVFKRRRVEEGLRSRPVEGTGGGRKKTEYKQEMVPVKQMEDSSVKGQYGDPKFLERIAWCIDTRLRVLGAYKSNPVNALVIQWDQLYARPTVAADPIERMIEVAGEVVDVEVMELEDKSEP